MKSSFLTRLMVISILWAGCQCVDPSGITSFGCEADGGCAGGLTCCDGTCQPSCAPQDAGRAGGAAGGGSAGGSNVAGGSVAGGDAGGTAQAGGDAGGSAQAGGDAGTAGGAPDGGAAGGSGTTGQQCTSGTECASGICAQGRCCARACSSACESCAQAGREGECAVLPEGTASSCAPFVCDGQPTCPTTCTTARQCAAGSFCDMGVCLPTRANGQTCTSGFQCSSGTCANGVCCNSPCSGSCDRCDLMPNPGTCVAARSGDLGEPLCGGSVTCNGTDVDCPIPCTAGCPSTTYCSGTLCSAKKPIGLACGNGNECLTGHCVDGVCCNGACGGGSTTDCQACNRVGSVGACSNLGSSVECRPSVGPCDAPEQCDGTNPTCPADATTARNGMDCGTTTTWSGTCAPAMGTACPTAGAEAGASTTRTCSNNACVAAVPADTSRACTYDPSGRDCGSATVYGTCMQTGGGCSLTGTQMGTTTPKTCAANGTCVTGATVPASQSCNFDPSGMACGSPTTTWSGMCVQTGGGCSTTGTEAGTINSSTCSRTGLCQVSSTTPTSRACTFNPNGTPCGMSTTWSGTCTQNSGGGACNIAGTEAGTIISNTCNAGGSCVATGSAATSRSCTFNPSGIDCGSTTTWSGTCVGGTTCALTGTESGTITASTCSAAGVCTAGTPTATSRGCTRNPAGNTCGAPRCLDCNGPADACGDLNERQCDSAGGCGYVPTGELCQCAGSTNICPL